MKILIFVLALFVIINSGFAQVDEKSGRQFYKNGDWEFGYSLSIGSGNKHKTGTNSFYFSYDSSQYYYSYDQTVKDAYVPLGVSIGYYIINGLSIEPELSLLLSSDGVSVSMLGNICYTFYISKKSIYPYIKLGYGLSENPNTSESLEFNTINASVGIKLTYRSGMAFRIEINYRNSSGSSSYYYSNQSSSSSFTSETILNLISISFGASILF